MCCVWYKEINECNCQSNSLAKGAMQVGMDQLGKLKFILLSKLLMVTKLGSGRSDIRTQVSFPKHTFSQFILLFITEVSNLSIPSDFIFSNLPTVYSYIFEHIIIFSKK